MEDLYNFINPNTGKHFPIISSETYDIVMANANRLNDSIDYERDFAYTYFGFKTLKRSYLLKINGKVCRM